MRKRERRKEKEEKEGDNKDKKAIDFQDKLATQPSTTEGQSEHFNLVELQKKRKNWAGGGGGGRNPRC